MGVSAKARGLRVKRRSLQGDGAGACACAERGATSVDCSGYVVLVHIALGEDGLVDVDGAGTALGIEREAGVWGGVNMDAARAGFDTPFVGWVAGDFD